MPEENLQKNMSGDEVTSGIPQQEGNFGKGMPQAPDNFGIGTLKPLRTYQGDASNAIGKTKASIITIAVAEQNRKAKIEPEPERESNPEIKNKIFIFVGTFLFVLGIIVVGVIYFISIQNKTVQVSQNGTILNYDKEINVSIANTTHVAFLQSILDQEKNLNLPANSVLYLNTTSGVGSADSQTVLQILAPKIPLSLLRNLSQDYMIGIYSFDKNQPFIILTVDDYGQGFSGMLKWEDTMVSDLGQIFGITPLAGSDSTGYIFTDESLNNKDLRIVQNSSRQTILLYSFIDKNTILITSNENTFSGLLNKYLIGKMVK
jgi:hypothetical protein